MPREQITYNTILESHTGPTVDGIPSATINVERARRNIHVSWNRTGWVQVGIDLTVAELRDILAHAESEAAAAARAQAEFGEYMTEAHQVHIWSDTLERPELNKAIQALRRGRDAAYGKDA